MKKPYRQGFNEKTGDILVVCSPKDVQEALGRNGFTIPRRRAIQLMRDHAEALTCAYQIGWSGEWMESIQLVLDGEVRRRDRTVRHEGSSEE